MLASGRRLGAHLPLGHGMVKAADRAVEIGATAIQVFTDNPTAWRRRPTLPGRLPEFRQRLTAAGIAPLVVHAPYLANLAGPDPDVFERSVAVLANELRVAAAWGAAVVNVHLGSHRGAGFEAGLGRLTDGLSRVLADVGTGAPGVTVVLENGTGGGSGIGSSVRRARPDRGVDRRGGRRSAPVRLVPRRRPPLGRRLRDGRAGGRGRARGRVRPRDRPRAAAAGPPQRLAVASAGRGWIATSTSARA